MNIIAANHTPVSHGSVRPFCKKTKFFTKYSLEMIKVKKLRVK